MASGSINGGAYSGGYDYYMTWSSTSRGSESNSSDVTLNWIMKKKVSGTYYNAYNTTGSTNITLNINGSTQTTNAPFDMRYDDNGAERVLASYTVNVPHNSDGTKSITVSGSHATGLGGSGWGTVSISDTTINLDTIPRYANITSFSVSKRDETSVLFNWSADSECDWAWYSTDGGNTWANLDNSNVVWGLSANTWYAFKLRVRRKDSQLTKDSDTVWQQTYDYPYISSSPNFDIGNQMSIGIYNPLNRNCQVYIIASDNSAMGGDTTTGTSISGYYNSSWQNFWYASIPNSSYGDYRVRLVVSSLNRDTTVSGGRYYAKEIECKALLSMSVVDTNSDITTLLGSNTKFLKYLSKPQVTLTPTAKYGASIVGQTISLGDGQYAYTLSHTFNKIENSYVTGTVKDSRGFYTTTEVILDMVDYIKLAITKFELSKPEGTSDEVKITLEGNWFNDDFVENTHNTLTINLDYKLATSSTWTNYGTLTPTITNNTFKVTDLSLGNIYDFDKEYQFRVTITDTVDEISEIESIRGQEAFAIGDKKLWIYEDNLYINDSDIINSYSTSEIKTHKKWIDGKPIYRKVIYVSELPNGYNDSGIKSIATGITNIDFMVNMYGIYTGTGNHSYEKYPINYIRRDNSIYDISTEYGYYDGSMSIIIRSTMGSGYKGYVILEYTKTTD